MDGLFVLGQESRQRILQQAAARIPGCAYLCAWAPVAGAGPASSSSSSSAAATSSLLLRCVDAWLCDGAGAPRRRDGGRARALFDAYRGSFCAIISGCVPGWAHIDGRAYMELPARDLAASASLPQQQQFYQEAGIETAAFMGCESGEIEVGMSTTATSSSPVSLQTNLQQVFLEEFFQQSLIEEFLHLPPTRPSSPSSSLPSVSVDSPAAEGSTSLLRSAATMAVTSASTTCSGERQVPVAPPRLQLSVPFGLGYAHFPSPEADDAVMAQAMLDVISAATSPSSSSSRRAGTRTTTAFRPYNAALAPRAPLRRQPGVTGQRMIKMGISILRRMQMLRFTRDRDAATTMAQQQRGQEAQEVVGEMPAPSSSQLNHMISERRRRERLNESFEALRGLLPPGSKKDKATVLAKTLEYMNILVSQISDLEARNRSLESRAHQRANGGSKELMAHLSEPQPVLQGPTDTSERVQVHVAGAASTSSRPQEVTVQVEVRAEGDVAELVTRVLAAIKETGRFTVAAVDARRPSDGVAQATFTLRATEPDDFDEESLKEAVMKAVEDLATTPTSDDL